MATSERDVRIHVLLVEADPYCRARLRAQVAGSPEPIQVTEVATVEEAFAAAGRGAIHAVVVWARSCADVNLGDLSRLSEARIAPLILVCKAHDAAQAQRLFAVGVDDILHVEDFIGPRICRTIEFGLSRAELRHDLSRAQNRARTLHAIMASLAAVSTEEACIEIILDGVTALGPPAAAIAMADGEDLVLVGSRGYPEEITSRFARFSIAVDDNPVSEAARKRAPVWLNTHDDLIRAYGTDHCLPRAGTRCVLPLLGGETCLGVLGMTFPLTWFPCADERLALEMLASQCAQAIERTRLYAGLERRLAFDYRLLGMVAHDLRNPLTTISLSAQSLLRSPASIDRVTRTANRLMDVTERAGRIVNDLLDYSMVQAGGLAIRPLPGDLFDTVRHCVEDARLRADGRDLVVSFSGAGQAVFDGVRIQQVLLNLLSNAITYGDPAAPVHVRAEGVAGRLYVEINNRGPLIPGDRLGEIFSPMRRGTQQGERGSIGLGLYICKAFVEAHGGRVWARSDEATGTTFTVELPREAAPRSSAHSPDAPDPIPPLDAASEDMPEVYAALLERFKDDALRAVLRHWLALGGAKHLPHPGRIDRARILAYLADMAFAAVEPGPAAPVFRFIEVGGALERRMGQTLASRIVDRPTSVAGPLGVDMYAAYRRCLSAAQPVYDYLSLNHQDPPGRFERLVLPFSQRGGGQVTHLCAVIRFANLPDAHAGGSPP